MSNMEMTRRPKGERPQRKFMEVMKEDMLRVGVTEDATDRGMTYPLV